MRKVNSRLSEYINKYCAKKQVAIIKHWHRIGAIRCIKDLGMGPKIEWNGIFGVKPQLFSEIMSFLDNVSPNTVSNTWEISV